MACDIVATKSFCQEKADVNVVLFYDRVNFIKNICNKEDLMQHKRLCKYLGLLPLATIKLTLRKLLHHLCFLQLS